MSDNIVATQKHRSHEGKKILLFSRSISTDQPMRRSLVALDAVAAGIGDRVLVVQEGFSAMTSVGTPNRRSMRAVIGVVDLVELDVIAHLRGSSSKRTPSRVVVDVNGVGYEVFVPLTTFTAMPDRGAEVSIDIHTHVREDIIALYGFSITPRAHDFRKADDDFRHRAEAGRDDSFRRIGRRTCRRDQRRRSCAADGDSRVGKKTAERIVVELRDKLQEFAARPAKSTVETDVLVGSGKSGLSPRPWRKRDAARAWMAITRIRFDVLFKRALQILTKG